MGRILAIDYGKKRTGLAVTDPLKLIASGLQTVETRNLRDFIKNYFVNEEVECVIVGWPLDLDGHPTDSTDDVSDFVRLFRKDHPDMKLVTVDERYTSKMASAAMLEMGMKKKERQKKENVDMISATIMLQEYLQRL